LQNLLSSSGPFQQLRATATATSHPAPSGNFSTYLKLLLLVCNLLLRKMLIHLLQVAVVSFSVASVSPVAVAATSGHSPDGA